MDGPLGRPPARWCAGKIADCLAVVAEHRDVLEADLRLRGIALESLTIREAIPLVDILTHADGTGLRRAMVEDTWTLTDHLLALVYDELRLHTWQRTRDGKKNRRRPKPISPLAKRGTRYGKTDRDPDEVKAYLARFGPPPS